MRYRHNLQYVRPINVSPVENLWVFSIQTSQNVRVSLYNVIRPMFLQEQFISKFRKFNIAFLRKRCLHILHVTQWIQQSIFNSRIDWLLTRKRCSKHMLHTHTHIYIYIRVCVCVCVTYAYIYACNISVCYTHTRKHIYIYIWAYYCVLFTFQKIGWGFGLAWQFIKNFPLKKTVGNVSRLALSCRASNFQERITDVKRVMAALCFKKSYVYSQCEL